MSDYDVIDEVLAIAPGDRLDEIRAARPAARENAQRSYDALFSPIDDSEASLDERHAIAQFVAGLGQEPLLRDWYRAGLESSPAIAAAVDALVLTSAGTGPYGVYREPALSSESIEGPRLAIRDLTGGDLIADAVGVRLAAALEHAHLLVLRPREASREALQTLLDAGWSTTGIVTISQLIAFVSFQLRIVIGLGALQADILQTESAGATTSKESTR